MKPITKLASSTLPDGSVLDLWERDGFHFLLRDGVQTASSFSHGSNEAAAAMDAVQSLREEQAGQKSQDFNLRILKTGLMQPFCRSLRILQHSPVPD